MSYDLMVFEAASAPKTARSFRDWYSETVDSDEGHDYSDPANTSPTLRSWYRDMIGSFPAMNGPDQAHEFTVYVTEYVCSKHAIYVEFRWDVARLAYIMVRQLAEKHRLGFFDASGDGDVFGPLETGYGRWFKVSGI